MRKVSFKKKKGLRKHFFFLCPPVLLLSMCALSITYLQAGMGFSLFQSISHAVITVNLYPKRYSNVDMEGAHSDFA